MPVTLRVGLVALLSLVMLTACNRSQAEGPAPAGRVQTVPAVRPIGVTVGRAEARTVQRSVETSSSLLAWEEVQAKTEQPGTIARLRADLGDRVGSGTVLADYDRREFELAVDQARAAVSLAQAQLRRQRDTLATLDAEVARSQSQFDWARSELERSQQLYERQLIALRDVDSARNGHNTAAAQLAAAKVALAQYPDMVKKAEAELERQHAALGIAEKRLRDTTVRASIDGLVAKRHVSAGEYVKENTPLFTVVVTHPLKYTGTVPERHAPGLKIGQAVRLTVEAYPGRDFAGEVLRVAPAVDVQTRTLVLEARVPNESGALRPGFFAKGRVLTESQTTAVFVPADAIYYVAGLSKLFVVNGASVQERLVRPGERRGPWVEILPAVPGADAVKAGEAVAVSNLPFLFHNAPVSISTGK